MVGLRDRPQGAVVMTHSDLGNTALQKTFEKIAEVYEWPPVE